MALNPNPGVSEQISDQQRTAADQNAAHVAVIAANTAAGTQVHKHGQVAGPGSFTAHGVYHPVETASHLPTRPPVAPGGTPAGGISSSYSRRTK